MAEMVLRGAAPNSSVDEEKAVDKAGVGEWAMTPRDAYPRPCPACGDHALGTRQIFLRTGLALLVKAALLAALYLLFFSPSHRPLVNSHSVADRMLGQAPDKGASP